MPIVAPIFTLPEIGLALLPLAIRIIQPFLESPELLITADMQVEFQNMCPVIAQVPFKLLFRPADNVVHQWFITWNFILIVPSLSCTL